MLDEDDGVQVVRKRMTFYIAPRRGWCLTSTLRKSLNAHELRWTDSNQLLILLVNPSTHSSHVVLPRTNDGPLLLSSLSRASKPLNNGCEWSQWTCSLYEYPASRCLFARGGPEIDIWLHLAYLQWRTTSGSKSQILYTHSQSVTRLLVLKMERGCHDSQEDNHLVHQRFCESRDQLC